MFLLKSLLTQPYLLASYSISSILPLLIIVSPEMGDTNLSIMEKLPLDEKKRAERSSIETLPSEDLEKATDPAVSPKAAEPPEYPPPHELIPILGALYLATFLVALDRTIIATAIPRITDQFHSLNDIGWYGSAYMLTGCAFQLFLGRLYTFYSAKSIFLCCIVVFEVGSAICGAAPSSPVFIVGRAIAGLGAAGIFSGAIVLQISVVPLHKRPVYTSLNGVIFGISSVIGPCKPWSSPSASVRFSLAYNHAVIGGAFTTNVSWRWCCK